jgi:hypothetical protein
MTTRRRRSALLATALVLLMHAALVVLLLRATPPWRRGEAPVPARASIVWLRDVPARAAAAPPREAREPRPPAVPPGRRAPQAHAARAVAQAAPAAPSAPAVAQTAAPSASAADAAPPRLLDTDATRRAIRQAARTRSLPERAATASEEPATLTPEQRLGREVAQSAIGECLKGEYAGGGMGVLSLPFWLLAEARGKCRR